MEQTVCICSVFSLQSGESTQEMGMYLAKLLWEKQRQRILYVPAGMQFEGSGEVSMTELYFAYRKKQPLPLPPQARKPVFVSPFHCFLEGEEMQDAQYYDFMAQLAARVDCMVASLEGVSPGQLHWFLEHSHTVAVLVDCTKGAPAERFFGFLKNLKLLWGEELGERLKRFLFILSGGNAEEKASLQMQLRQEVLWLEAEAEGVIFVTEEELGRQKSLFGKKGKHSGRIQV